MLLMGFLIILTYLLLVKYKFGLTTLLQQGIPEQNVNDHSVYNSKEWLKMIITHCYPDQFNMISMPFKRVGNNIVFVLFDLILYVPSRSRVKHYTTEPLRSLGNNMNIM